MLMRFGEGKRMNDIAITDALAYRQGIFSEINAERERQNAKYGFPQPLEQYLSILGAEFGEVAHECKWPGSPNLRNELLQVAAVCVQWVEALDAAADEEASE